MLALVHELHRAEDAALALGVGQADEHVTAEAFAHHIDADLDANRLQHGGHVVARDRQALQLDLLHSRALVVRRVARHVARVLAPTADDQSE